MSHSTPIYVGFTLVPLLTMVVCLSYQIKCGMNYLNFEQATDIFCTRAASFPEGIKEAHDKLHDVCPDYTKRTYFAVSHGGENGVVYMPGVTEHFPNELQKTNLHKFTVLKGRYAYIDLNNFMENLSELRQIFDDLLKHPELDPKGYCLEWYLNANVCRCMVKLKN